MIHNYKLYVTYTYTFKELLEIFYLKKYYLFFYKFVSITLPTYIFALNFKTLKLLPVNI